MFQQFIFVNFCVLAVLGLSPPDDVGKTVTPQTQMKLFEERMANRFTILEAKYQSKFETLEKENSLLKSELVSLKSDVALLSYGSDSMHDNTTTVGTSRPSLVSGDRRGSQRTVRVSTSHVRNQVAFQALLDHEIGNLGDDETIKFNRLDLNLGNGYNAIKGIFTCSVSGLYVFHINIVNHKGKSAELHFVKNGQEFGRVYMGDEDNDRSDSASSTALVQLDISDDVWIATNSNHDTGDVLLAGYCYFSGYLLFPELA